MALDSQGDVYIADTYFDQVEEVYAPGGQAWGRSSSTAGHLYFLAGSPSATAGASGGGGAATAGLLYLPAALGVDGAGDVYLADSGNNRVEEIPVVTGTWHGKAMTRYDIYTIAGPNSGACTGSWANGAPKIFQGRNLPQALVRAWKGSLEYEIPGRPSNYRILYNPRHN